jgi:hypothetical protein
LTVALSVSLTVMAFSLVSFGCETGHGVTFENQTNERLSVYRSGRYSFTLEPSEKETYTIFRFAGSMAIEAKENNGTVVYSKAFTWEQLMQMNWEIVITDTRQMPSPSPTASVSPP